MRTIGERDKLDKRFRRICRFGRYVSKHISSKLGQAIEDWGHDMWDESYYGRR